MPRAPRAKQDRDGRDPRPTIPAHLRHRCQIGHLPGPHEVVDPVVQRQVPRHPVRPVQAQSVASETFAHHQDRINRTAPSS